MGDNKASKDMDEKGLKSNRLYLQITPAQPLITLKCDVTKKTCKVAWIMYQRLSISKRWCLEITLTLSLLIAALEKC